MTRCQALSQDGAGCARALRLCASFLISHHRLHPNQWFKTTQLRSERLSLGLVFHFCSSHQGVLHAGRHGWSVKQPAQANTAYSPPPLRIIICASCCFHDSVAPGSALQHAKAAVQTQSAWQSTLAAEGRPGAAQEESKHGRATAGLLYVRWGCARSSSEGTATRAAAQKTERCSTGRKGSNTLEH